MKISTLLLSLCGLSVFYLCYADWIDDLLQAFAEDYLGSDYEEVAPFIPSVIAGTKEFDSIVEALSKSPKNKLVPYFVGAAVASLAAFLFIFHFLLSGKCLEFVQQGRVKLRSEWDSRKRKSRKNRNRLPGFLSGIFSRKTDRRLRTGVGGDDVPVQVIWKGNGLMESSVHCNLKDKVHKEIKPGLRATDYGGGDDPADINGSSGSESTMHRLAEIRKLLQSKPEGMRKLVDKSAGTEDFPEKVMSELRQRLESDMSVTIGHPRKSPKTRKPLEEDRSGTCVSVGFSVDSLTSACEECGDELEKDSAADPKLMNRIRLLESRLRLEEIKNRNWISRMSRAEGILQHLNKQVERIERSQPVETTLLETLKITSTVTNWMPVTQPRNLQFTLVKEYPLQQPMPKFESLSEYIKGEITLPCPQLDSKRFVPLQKSLVKAVPAQPSILSKFLSK